MQAITMSTNTIIKLQNIGIEFFIILLTDLFFKGDKSYLVLPSDEVYLQSLVLARQQATTLRATTRITATFISAVSTTTDLGSSSSTL